MPGSIPVQDHPYQGTLFGVIVIALDTVVLSEADGSEAQ